MRGVPRSTNTAGPGAEQAKCSLPPAQGIRSFTKCSETKERGRALMPSARPLLAKTTKDKSNCAAQETRNSTLQPSPPTAAGTGAPLSATAQPRCSRRDANPATHPPTPAQRRTKPPALVSESGSSLTGAVQGRAPAAVPHFIPATGELCHGQESRSPANGATAFPEREGKREVCQDKGTL